MMLEPVMIVRLEIINKAMMRLVTSLAIFSESMGFSCWLTPPVVCCRLAGF
jgi:hypothetical protein